MEVYIGVIYSQKGFKESNICFLVLRNQVLGHEMYGNLISIHQKNKQMIKQTYKTH